MAAQWEHEDSQITDREAGWALRVGTLVGVPVIYVLTALVVMAAGGSWTTALVVSVWPAIVGGPFFGGLFALASRMGRDHRHARGVPVRQLHAVR